MLVNTATASASLTGSAAPTQAAAQPILAVKNIEVIYDHVILVLRGVSFEVPQGKIVALLGANGAGKSTTLKSVSTLLASERGEVTKGSIEFRGKRTEALAPGEMVGMGMVQVMEGRHCFGHLTVEDNLITGAYARPINRAQVRDELEKIYDYFPRLKTRRTSLAGYTSGGEQALMVAVGVATERLVLRPLVGQSEDTLLMATIGLAFVIEGAAQLAWGVKVRGLDLGIADVPMGWLADNADILVSQLDVAAGLVAGLLVAVLALIFSKTKVGRGLRAVADDNAAALSVGIPLKQILVVVWATAGVVALVAGMVWGARSGVQFALVGVALKAMPVLIIGGFTSVPGVIVAGLIVGAAEKIAEVYAGPFVGGGIEGWLPYVLAVLFLLVRPEGLFGEKIIRRV